MENYNAIISSISTVGFPIVITLIMIYVVYIMNKNHKDETNELRKSIENNTLAITQLIELIHNKGV